MDISEDYQKKLLPYAYNILGSIEDARDVIQDVLIDHFENVPAEIQNHSAYLIKSVINKSINLKLRSKRITGTTWLPEPIATEDADKTINSQEILSYAMLVLLEFLNPKERAVFVLKEAFDYSHQEISKVFSITIDHSRQLLTRAKGNLKKQVPGFNLNIASYHDEFLSGYVDIIRNGKVDMLEKLLAEHITLQADGGGKGKMLSEFTSGIQAVSSLGIKGYDYLKKCRIKFKKLNHFPALQFYSGDKLICCQIFHVDRDGKINNIYVVADPLKLKNL